MFFLIVAFSLLVYIAVVLPFRIAFVESDSTLWVVANFTIDALFAFDVFITFFTAYYDENYNLITDKKTITLAYLKSWFIIDILSILPFSSLLNTAKNYNSLARIARLPRIYKLLKIAKYKLRIFIIHRLVRMLKIVKQRKKFITSVSDVLKLNDGVERLMCFIIFFFFLCHISGCLWYFLYQLDSNNVNSWIWRNGFQDAASLDVSLHLVLFLLLN